jgi:hypothetical protein
MKLTSRKAYEFIDIEVDEIRTTIFKSSETEIKDTINNLLEVVMDLASYTGKSVSYFVKKGDF